MVSANGQGTLCSEHRRHLLRSWRRYEHPTPTQRVGYPGVCRVLRSPKGSSGLSDRRAGLQQGILKDKDCRAYRTAPYCVGNIIQGGLNLRD